MKASQHAITHYRENFGLRRIPNDTEKRRDPFPNGTLNPNTLGITDFLSGHTRTCPDTFSL